MTSFFYSIQGGILILFFMSMKVFLDSQLSSLVFFFADNLHSNDVDLRSMLKRVWPNITKKTLDRVVPKRPQG